MTEDAPAGAGTTEAPSPRALQTLIDRSTDLTALIDGDGHLRYLSGAAERVWGYDPARQVGRHFGDYIHPDDLGLVAARFALARDLPGATIGIEFRLRRADGAWRHAEVRATNLLADPDVDAMVIHLRDVHDRIEAARELTWRAHHDSLTGLANRAVLLDRIDAALAAAADGGDPPALLYIDLDGFKAVNDSFGHEAGDRLLAAIGGRLRHAVRTADCAARIGGDEFVVLVDQHPAPARVRDLAERLVTTLRRPVSLVPHGPTHEVTASIGIAFATGGGAADLLDRADRALYAAKRRGRGRTEVFVAPEVRPPDSAP